MIKMYSHPQINIPSTFKVIGEETESLDELAEFKLAGAPHGAGHGFEHRSGHGSEHGSQHGAGHGGSEHASFTIPTPWFLSSLPPLPFSSINFFF